MSTIEFQSQRQSEDVFDWRFTELMRAGFSADVSWRLASDPAVDIRLAERLLAGGCSCETAQRILL